MRARWLIAALVVVLLAAGGAALVVLRSGGEETTSPEQRRPERALTFTPGVQAGTLARDVRMAAKLGAPVARVEWDIKTTAATLRPVVAAYAREGIRVQPVAGFERRVATAAEARNVGAWAREVGPQGAMWQQDGLDPKLAVQDIEFGTETSFAYQGTEKRGAEYARSAVVASKAAKAAGVGLFIQADDANQVDGWINQMYGEVPDLHRYAAAWIVHPYGPQWRRRLDWAIARTDEQGAPRLPIAITEYGIANDAGRCLSDNYGWPTCLTAAEAGAILRRVVREMRAEYPRIEQFILYNNHDLAPPGYDDDRENYFGARRWNGAAKGAFTEAADALMRER